MTAREDKLRILADHAETSTSLIIDTAKRILDASERETWVAAIILAKQRLYPAHMCRARRWP